MGELHGEVCPSMEPGVSTPAGLPQQGERARRVHHTEEGSMNIKVRKAAAADAELVAWAIMSGSRAGKETGLFDLIFQCEGEDALLASLMRLITTSTKCFCHLDNFLIAETGGVKAGLLCAYEPRIATREIFARALAEVGVDESYEERIAGYLLCEPDTDRQTWMIDYIVETPGHDSFEVVRELVQKSLLTARLKGYRKVQTTVEIGASHQRMIVEKLGFAFLDEKRSQYYKELFGRPGIMRYGITL